LSERVSLEQFFLKDMSDRGEQEPRTVYLIWPDEPALSDRFWFEHITVMDDDTRNG
jgi:hypothetical protein